MPTALLTRRDWPAAVITRPPQQAIPLQLKERRPDPAALDGFWNHGDGATGAFLRADAATLAEVIVELEAITRPQLDHGIIRANAIAIITFKAISA